MMNTIKIFWINIRNIESLDYQRLQPNDFKNESFEKQDITENAITQQDIVNNLNIKAKHT